MKKYLPYFFSILPLYLYAPIILAGFIPKLYVMSFVDRDSFASHSPQEEKQEDQDLVSECQSYIDSSLKNLKTQNFLGAIDDARKINSLFERNLKVLISTDIAIRKAQRKLIKIIAAESAEIGSLDFMKLAVDIISSIPHYHKCQAGRELENLLYSEVIRIGLEQRDFNIVISAAVARPGAYSADTSWDSIIRELVILPQMPKIDGFELIFTEPRWYGTTGEYGREIFEILKKHNWKLPGYDVFFSAYDIKEKIYWKIKEIRGPNFYMGFDFTQGSIDVNLNDTAGLDSVVIPRLGAKFYEDDSGPMQYSYTGTNWEANKLKFLKRPFLSQAKNWPYRSLTKDYQSQQELRFNIANYFYNVALPEIRRIDSEMPLL